MEFQEKAKQINEQFKLNGFVGQDWSAINADSEKLNEFIAYYLRTDDAQELSMIFDLIINSLQELNSLEKVQQYWSEIENKVQRNIKLHFYYLTYYSRIGELPDEDDFFLYTEFISDWLVKVIKESRLSIHSNQVKDIWIDEAPLNEWIERKPFPLSFDAIIEYLKLKEIPEDNCLSYQDGDDKIIRDSIYIKKGNHKEYTFLELFAMKGTYHFLKFKTNNINSEIDKF